MDSINHSLLSECIDFSEVEKPQSVVCGEVPHSRAAILWVLLEHDKISSARFDSQIKEM